MLDIPDDCEFRFKPFPNYYDFYLPCLICGELTIRFVADHHRERLVICRSCFWCHGIMCGFGFNWNFWQHLRWPQPELHLLNYALVNLNNIVLLIEREAKSQT